MTSCCAKSCWCAPFRWISRCCCGEPPSEDMTVNKIAVAVISTHSNHHRERTWQMSKGRMIYERSHAEWKEPEPSDGKTASTAD